MMNDRKKGNATNEEINLQTDALTDLPAANEQADTIKGSAMDIYLMQDYTNAAQKLTK
jgi:hypothetical protein